MYAQEPHRVVFLIDNKSFYASVECVARHLNPLKTPLVVMSEQENTNGGLILATSPTAKANYGLQANVSRQRDLPQDPALIVVPPRVNLYIKRNLAINTIFQRFTAAGDCWPYSIDESVLDVTRSWRLFGASPLAVAKRIQATVHRELGLYLTIGIGENPLQAKLALDLFAKHTPDLIGELSYATFAARIWPLTELDAVWSIGARTAKRLKRLGVTSMYDLAHLPPAALKAEFGIIGTQLFALAWGVDRSELARRIRVRAPSIGNSQVLPRDYATQEEIERVITEIAQQVAARLRHHHRKAGRISLSIGFSYAASAAEQRSGFSHSATIPPTNQDAPLAAALVRLFRKAWQGQVVRNVAVSTGHLAPDVGEQLNLLEPVRTQLHRTDLNRALDDIRTRFGFTRLVYATSLLQGATAIARAGLVGGHNGGNAYD
ncbi:Y-family DNA polymerase [Lacticaseibacillus parakribbianus]|uniref:Y-family DNA polymerase n=1 Tax=Lacticaseibacillus parakribbianus TaxID=2970927 RepID=UPI0021CB6A4B|nr:Y-family DNA polymerase [Lacticaseibacillus parakribbianus]